jgi:hypothetical protein
MSINKILIFLTIIYHSVECELNGSTLVEFLLTKDLFTNYTKTARPTDLVNVALGLRYFQLISIDEKNGIMTSVCVITQVWSDQR